MNKVSKFPLDKGVRYYLRVSNYSRFYDYLDPCIVVQTVKLHVRLGTG